MLSKGWGNCTKGGEKGKVDEAPTTSILPMDSCKPRWRRARCFSTSQAPSVLTPLTAIGESESRGKTGTNKPSPGSQVLQRRHTSFSGDLIQCMWLWEEEFLRPPCFHWKLKDEQRLWYTIGCHLELWFSEK
ncbi:LYR motif-containing protein 1 isoform X2 [Talpa occidentalis]|uniref:LYR motif-containing protein 1 isoform X2 n=1 Tax=Talpa occidentalis TaxID=50954 RepID=UPI0018908BE3|nr:LYR motif-containing protein 1 isoform X2 [Talpa occidentalis]